MNYRLVVFDNDGVLVDSEPLLRNVVERLARQHGVSITEEERLSLLVGRPVAVLWQLLENRSNRRINEIEFLSRFDELVIDSFPERLDPVPGVEEVIDSILVTSCVASGASRHHVMESLRLTNLCRYFPEAAVITGDRVLRGKPAPDLFEFAARSQRVRPAECIVIEDSVAGVLAGKAAGMLTIGYAQRTPPSLLADADHVVGDMIELRIRLSELKVATAPSVRSDEIYS